MLKTKTKMSIRYLTLFILFFSFTAHISAQQLPEHPRIQSELISMDSDRIMLKQTLIVDATIEEVWPYFTKADLYTKWSAPLAEIDFKINGLIRANYNPEGTIGDENTIIINILNYVPEKFITLQSVLPDAFPAFLKEIEKDLYNIIEFEATDSGKTEIKSYGIGYKNDDQFMQMISFFANGNIDYYQKLIQLIE